MAYTLGYNLDPMTTTDIGPVDVTWSNPSYMTFTETFSTLEDALEEMDRREGNTHWPLWKDTVATFFHNDEWVASASFVRV